MGCTVEAVGLRKVYRAGFEAVKGVSLRVGAGETASLMGPNGSGKTTTLQRIAGVLSPTAGVVRVCGYDVWGDGWERARSLVGFAPQDPPFPRSLTGLEALEVLAGLFGVGRAGVRSDAGMLLEELGFPGLLGVRVSRMSGGQRRALTIVLALLGEPEVLVLDEPSSGLDPRARERLWGSISKLMRGRTVLFSTHDPGEAEEVSTATFIFHRGRVAAAGRPKELIERYAPRARVRVWSSSPPPPSLRARRSSGGFAEFEVESERDVAAIVAAYAEAGLPVERVELVRPGLREVFFEVTGEELEG